MKTLIDYVASSALLMILITSVLILFAILMGMFLNPFKDKKFKVGYIFFLTILACSPIFVLSGSKLGIVKEVSDLKIIDDKICFTDVKIYHGDYETYYTYRIHVIDPETGERQDRTVLGDDVVWVDVKNDLILFQEQNKYLVYKVSDFKIIAEVDEKYLEQTFPEFSVGVESISLNGNCISVLAKDGKSYFYDIYTDKIIPDCENEIEYLYEEYSNYGFQIVNNNKGYPFVEFYFVSENPNDVLKYAAINKNNSEQIVSKDGFIEGNFSEIIEDKEIILIMSYETTEKERYFITALNFDMETLWKLDYDSLYPKDMFTKKNAQICKFADYNGNLIISIGGFFYCVNAETGEIIWKNRF